MIGYLVGYKASNIWRIWVPRAHKVINARDCVFDETNFYSPNPLNHLIDDISGRVLETEPLSHSEFMSIIQDISDPHTEEISDDILPMEVDQPETTNNNQNGPESTINDQNIINEPDSDQILGDIPVSPPETPEISGCPSETEDQTDQHSDIEDLPILSQLEIPSDDLTPEARVSNGSPNFMVYIDNTEYDQASLGNPKRDRSLSPDTENKRLCAYITGQNTGQNTSQNIDIYKDNIYYYYMAFSTALHNQPKRVHQDDLPPKPDGWNNMMAHPYKDEFLQAAEVEYRKLEQMNIWLPIKRETILTEHDAQCFEDLKNKAQRCPQHQVLPLRWVFTYKTD
jgi:hypothetical protein